MADLTEAGDTNSSFDCQLRDFTGVDVELTWVSEDRRAAERSFEDSDGS